MVLCTCIQLRWKLHCSANDFLFSAGCFHPIVHGVWCETTLSEPCKLDAINSLLTFDNFSLSLFTASVCLSPPHLLPHIILYWYHAMPVLGRCLSVN